MRSRRAAKSSWDVAAEFQRGEKKGLGQDHRNVNVMTSTGPPDPVLPIG